MNTKLLITALAFCGTANAQLYFQKSIGSSNHEQNINSCALPNGGLIISGETKPSTGFTDAFAVCLNSSYDTAWAFTYGGSNNDGFSSVKNTFDGGFVLAGTSYSFSSGGKALVVKTNAGGIIQWAKIYGGGSGDFASDIIQASDSGFVVAGSTYSIGAGSNDFYLFKIDKTGTLIWAKAYGGPLADYGFKVIETADKGYTVIGSATSFCTSYSAPPYIVHTDSVGNVLWSKCIGMSTGYSPPDIDTIGTDYIVAGAVSIGFQSNNNAYLMRLSSSGSLIWSNRYDVSTSGESSYSVDKTTDGGFILAGQTHSCGSGGANAFLLKVSSAGDTAWTKVYGTADYDIFNYIASTSDGGFIAAGASYVYPGTNGDVFLVKSDSLGYVPSCPFMSCAFQKFNNYVTLSNPATASASGGVETPVTLTTNHFLPALTNLCGTVSINSNVSDAATIIYPNPFSSTTTLQTDKLLKDATLTVYNFYGQTVKQIKNISGQTVDLHRDNLPSGLYFLHITQDSKVIAIDKLVIEEN